MQSIDRKDIGSELISCSCEACKCSTPFYFPLEDQKIMLRTSCPSLQTVRGSLLSIRFLRQVLYALFGKLGMSEDRLKVLLDGNGIYWTHFNKCYYPKFFDSDKAGYFLNPDDLPSHCAEKYLCREILALKNLELIIVMGKASGICFNAFKSKHESMFRRFQDKILYVGFPKDAAEDEFDEMRKRVSQILKMSQPSDRFKPDLVNSKATGPMVGRSIEMNAINHLPYFKAYSYVADTAEKTMSFTGTNELDNLWVDKVMNPINARSMAFTKSWVVIEKGIKNFLYQHFDPQRDRYRRLGLDSIVDDIKVKSQVSNNETVESCLFDCPAFKWQVLMDRYLDALVNRRLDRKVNFDPVLYRRWKEVSNALNILRNVRNTIVHADGFIPAKELESGSSKRKYEDLDGKLQSLRVESLRFDGIVVYTNLIYISDQGMDAMRGLVNKIYRLLEELDKCILQ